MWFKQPVYNVTGDTQMRRNMNATADNGINSINNTGTRVSIGNPKSGFQTLLNTDRHAALPTAPAIVGGNTDWTKSNVTPNTQFLHNFMSGFRPMKPIPALGASLGLAEPNVNSIHSQY